MSTFVLGTRGSDLALAQTRIVEGRLRQAHPDLMVETRVIRTTGDKRLDISLAAPGPLEKGLFTKELEEALFQGEIHAAIHSLKDLPTEMPPGLVLAAVLERADSSDVIVTKRPGGLAELPTGAVVGTSSPRRRAQLLALRADLDIREIRGNVPTRLRKLAEGSDLDAIVLAKAGLDRLGPNVVPGGLYVSVIEGMLPAPGQGAIAVQCHEGHADALRLLAAIHHEPTARCVAAERAFLQSKGGGCSLPIGALAVIVNGEVVLKVFPPEAAPTK